MPVAQLLEHHRQHLEAAAIDPEWAAEYGVRSVDTSHAPDPKIWPHGQGLLFPWTLVDGTVLWQARPDEPQGDAKYLFPKGSEIGLGRVRDPGGDWVFVVEGTKQSLAAACWLPSSSAVYGLAGCWNWRAADLHVMKNRQVFVILDADASSNSQVYKAGEKLRDALLLAGARSVEFPRLPVTGTKGLDDYLAEIRPSDRQDVLIRLAVSAVGKVKPADRRPSGRKNDGNTDGSGEFFDDAGFRTETFARALLDKSPGLVSAEGRVLLYRNGVYAFDRYGLRQAVTELLGDRYSSYLRAETEEMVANILVSEGREVPDHLPEPYLNLRNGLLDMRTLELKEHTPEVWSTNQLPVAWNPEAKCPYYIEWTSRQVARNRLEDLEEVSATCLDPTRTPRMALALAGPPRTGKSTWLRLLEAVVGAENTSHVDLTRLDQRFQVAGLYNKLVNASGDIPRAHLTDLSVFKQLTGQDTISAERKGQHPFDFVNRALIAFSANTLPTMDEEDFAPYAARVKPFRFERSFQGEEDLTVDKRLHAEAEGILVRWVHAWRRWYDRQERYQDTPLSEWSSQPVQRWLAERCEIHDVGTIVQGWDQATKKGLLADAFNQWREENAPGVPRLTQKTVTTKLTAVQTRPRIKEVRVREGTKELGVALNVTVRDDTPLEEEDSTHETPDSTHCSNIQHTMFSQVRGGKCVECVEYTESGTPRSETQKMENVKYRPDDVEIPHIPHIPHTPEAVLPGQVPFSDPHLASGVPHTLYVDLETTAYPPEHELGRIRTVQIAVDDGPVRVYHVESDQYAQGAVLALLNDPSAILVFHNAPGQDVRYLVHEGLLDEPVPWHRIRDTMFEAKIKVPSQERGHYKLERLEEDLLGSTKADEATAKRKKRFARGKWLTNTEIDTPPERNGWLQVPLDDPDFLEYAKTDVTVMRDLADHLETAEPGESAWEPPPTTVRCDKYSGSISALLDRERRLANLCLGMTRRGVLVDRDLATKMDAELVEEIEDFRRQLAEHGIDNPNSTRQIADALKRDGMEVPKTAKGNPSTDDAVLKDADSLVAKLVRAYRVSVKYRNTYTQAALKFSAFDGRVHAQINTAEASTWRMSITDPAMQTIPKYGSRLREMYVADPGYVLLSADLASVELRVGAAVSEDENLIQKFLSGESLWDEIRERVFPGAGKESKEHTKTKNVGYGSLFGAGAERLSEYTGSVELAAQIRREFWRAYPGLRALFNILMELSDEQREDGGKVILNSYGRSLWIPAAAPYKGLNYLIQSTARDLLVDAMFAIEDAGFGDYLWLPVHDELLLQVPENRVTEATDVLRDAMTATLGAVPITCEVSNPSERWSAK